MHRKSNIPKMGPVLSSLLTTFQKDTGGHVRAVLTPPRQSASSGFDLPFRFFSTTPKANISAGDIVIGAGSRKYLILYNGAAENEGTDYKTFKAIELDYTFAVRRVTEITDAVTGRVIKTAESVVNAAMPCHLQVLRESTDVLKVESGNYRIFTNYALQKGDRVGNYIVRKVDTVLGAIMAEVQ